MMTVTMPKYEIRKTASFKKDYKILNKRGCDIQKLEAVIQKLANGEKLPQNYQDHALKGKFNKYRECHINPDWLLIYQIIEDKLILILSQTGTHSDLFK